MAVLAFYAAFAVGAVDSPSRAVDIISHIKDPPDPAATAAILRDSFALAHGTPPQALARAPLWRPANEGGTPPAVRQAWRNRAQVLRENGKHWQVWVDWYDYVLEGSPPATQRDDAWERAFVDLPKPLPWHAGAQSVNTEIAARLRAHPSLQSEIGGPREIQLPDIPTQGYGPHFEIDEDGVINFAPPQALDRQGNNVVRLRKLHPILRTLSSDLVEALGRGNVAHHFLRDRAEAYRELIDQDIESVDFARLYVEGVRLANAMTAVASDKELPGLEHRVKEAIDSLLRLHGTFMLATAEGIEIIAAEERYQRTPQAEVEYRAATVSFAKSLQDEPDVIDPKAASFVLEAAEEIGRGTNPERSGVIASGTIKNVAIVVSTAGALGALSSAAVASGSPVLIVGSAVSALVFGEGLKKSKAFATLAGLITKGLDRAVEADVSNALSTLGERVRPQLRFVGVTFEPKLRRLAEQREEFDWLNGTLDWIKKHEPFVEVPFSPQRRKEDPMQMTFDQCLKGLLSASHRRPSYERTGRRSRRSIPRGIWRSDRDRTTETRQGLQGPGKPVKARNQHLGKSAANCGVIQRPFRADNLRDWSAPSASVRGCSRRSGRRPAASGLLRSADLFRDCQKETSAALVS